MSRQNFGYPGHLIVSTACLHHLHTHVGGHCVSTIGAYHPNHQRKGDTLGPMVTVGCERFFETYVFPLGPDGKCGFSFSEIDAHGYQTAEDADAGHEEMCRKYESLSVSQAEGK